MDRQKAEKLLEVVKEAQTAYWNAIGDLEMETSLEIDSTQDLSAWTLNGLLESAGCDVEEDEQELPTCEACGCTDGTCQHAA